MAVFSLRILTTKGADVDKWRDLVNRNPQADIYFTPEYAMLFETTKGEIRKSFGGKAQLLFYGNEQNYIIYPFFKREISELSFCEILGPETENWFDIVSPYGFTGPLACINKPEVRDRLWRDFGQEFHLYCVQNNIIAEFARLHPYFKNHLPLNTLDRTNVRKDSEVVYVDLEQDISLIRKGFTKGNKSSISKAQRSNVEIFCSNAKEELDAFYELYIDTMKRNKAKMSYFFSREFFDHVFQLLNRDVQLFGARYGEQIIAASLFLFNKKGGLAHYYLSGADANFLSLCPNNLLLYDVILWAKEQGYKIFNLGGGYKPDDSLFQFKASFSKTTADFYTYSRVHNEEFYKILCQARDEYDRAKDIEIAKSNYFPEYRR